MYYMRAAHRRPWIDAPSSICDDLLLLIQEFAWGCKQPMLADWDTVRTDRTHALLYGCTHGYLAIVEWATPAISVSYECALAIETACIRGYTDVVYYICTTSKEYYWGTVMSCASHARQIDIVRMAAAHGAGDWNGVLCAACANDDADLLDLAIARGANAWNPALAAACLEGHLCIAQQMVVRGANDYERAWTNALYGAQPVVLQWLARMTLC